jgi:hypothetical protein
MNSFRSLDFCSNQIQDQVIGILVKTLKERRRAREEAALDLMCQLFDCFNFGFKAFFKKYLHFKTQKISFLSYLLYGIYYNEIPISNLAHDKNREFLNEFLLTLLAECIPAKQTNILIRACSIKEQLRLVCHCFTYPREGSWIILQSLQFIHAKDFQWMSFLHLLRTKYYDIQTFRALIFEANFELKLVILKLEQKAEKQIRNIIALEVLPQPYSFDELRAFFKVFGLHGYYIDLIRENSLYEILQMALEIQRNPLLSSLSSSEIAKSFATQLFQELDTFHHHPLHYVEGLKRLVYALPTRGSQLPSQPWLPAILAALDQLIEHLHQKGFPHVHVNQYPIIIFDQAPALQLRRNQHFIKRLSKQYKAAILHISQEQTLKLAKKLSVKHWIKTTAKNEFGYAGSRNCVFFLAPVLFEAFRQGKKSFEEIMKMSRSDLKDLFKKATLGNSNQDIMIHMGEDDVDIPPSHLFLNASFAYRYQNLYVSRPVYCIGRATHAVNPLVDLKRLANKPSLAFFSSHWNPFPVSGRMKGMVTKPKFCLPLVFGNEELHVIPSHYICDYFHQPVTHLAGTRFPTKRLPISPLDGILEYLSTYLPYSLQICMSSYLTDPSNALQRSIFPWNDEALRTSQKFKSLGALLNYAALPEAMSEFQRRFWKNLEQSYSAPDDLFNLSIAALEELDLSVSAPPLLKKYYLNMQKEASDLRKLWWALIDPLHNSICLLKLRFLASSSPNFSAICSHIAEKFGNKSAQKSSIFSSKASYARGLINNKDLIREFNTEKGSLCDQMLLLINCILTLDVDVKKMLTHEN